MANDDVASGLTQRELILEIRSDMKDIKAALNDKADRRAVHAVETRIDGIDIRVMAQAERMTILEGKVQTQDAVSKGKAALLSAIIALIVMLVAVGGLLLKISGS